MGGTEPGSVPDSFLRNIHATKDENIIVLKNMNRPTANNKGYDLAVSLNGDVVEYIEVKSKSDEDPHLFEVSGSQWNLARKLYDHGLGDQYEIFLVSSAGKADKHITVFKNPYKLWLEGKMYADPVKIKL